MKIEIPNNLISLAKACKNHSAHLYIVGGFVRDALMGNKSHDVDICSSLSVKKVDEIAQELGFESTIINKKLGTIKLTKDNEFYEYTTFRKEEYNQDGSHTPTRVLFVDSVKADSVRRDFTINAIYYDILTKKIIDPRGGCDDIKQKILRTTTEPNITFTEDALRVLRLIRFACSLDFEIEQNTYRAAKNNSAKLVNLSSSRIIDELHQIIKLNKNVPVYINLINEFNILNIVFSSKDNVGLNFNICKNKTYYKNFCLNKSNDLTTFLTMVFLCAKATSFDNFVEKLNTVLKTNFLVDNKTHATLLEFFNFIEKLKSGQNLFATILFENLHENTKNLVSIFFNKIYTTLTVKVNKLKENNFPFKLDDLKISNAELLTLPIPNKHISETKKFLLTLCQNNELKNDNKKILEYLQKIYN